jgi:2',3'-cyclic-nucleotide 2'-phosphodiesterase/3'-nucleotidase
MVARPIALWAISAALLAGEPIHIRVLATTDLHGNIFPYDYYAQKPAPRGLAKIATLIARERNANTLLIDCGDTIQGSPLETVHQTDLTKPDPMMLVMNSLHYDAMVVGNHEFNYGLANLNAAHRIAKFPWLAANVEGPSGFLPMILKSIQGVSVAVIGVTTPAIPNWEREENYKGLRFADAVHAVKDLAADLRRTGRAQVIVVAAHSGLDRNPTTGSLIAEDLPRENIAYQIAAEAPVDAVIFGHTHSELASYRVGDVQMLQPRNWGMSLGELDLEVERVGATWKVGSKSSRVIPVLDSTPASEAILALAKPYHEAAEAFLNRPVAEVAAPLSAEYSRVEDTPLIDAIQTVELAEAHAQVSFASAFNLSVKVPAGKATVRQLAALYPYENTLYRIQGNGKTVREALENAARYYRGCSATCNQGPLINTEVIGYNYDVAQGVQYEIDLRRPEGSRIVNLRMGGQPLDDEKPVEIAVNSYRAGGSAGYSMFRGLKVLWRSSEDIREMMIRFYTARGNLPVSADGNWRVLPEEAHQELRREAQRETSQSSLR